MITYNRYAQTMDDTWYDSSNVIFSSCYNSDKKEKSVKIVFKEGRTYLYRNVDCDDYIKFKISESTGSGFAKYIKKYDSIRLSDTNLEELAKLKEQIIKDDTVIEESFNNNISYNMQINDKTGEFKLLLNDNTIYEGIEGQVSIVNLLKAMRINCPLSQLDSKLITETDFENKNIL